MASTRFTTEYEPKTGDIDVFFNYVKRIDTALYKCRAENMYGFDETKATLFIINVPNIDDKPLIDPSRFISLERPPEGANDQPEEAAIGKPPKFIIHLPEQVKFYDGERIHLKCKVEGIPAPKVNKNSKNPICFSVH